MDRIICTSRRIVYIPALQQIIFNAARCAFESMIRDQGQTTTVSFSSQNVTSILDIYVPEWMGEDAFDDLCLLPTKEHSIVCLDVPMIRGRRWDTFSMVLAFILQATEQRVSRCALDEEVAALHVPSLGASLTVFARTCRLHWCHHSFLMALAQRDLLRYWNDTTAYKNDVYLFPKELDENSREGVMKRWIVRGAGSTSDKNPS